jgi:hypothetical protein
MTQTWEERTGEFEVVADDGHFYRIEELAGMADVTPAGSLIKQSAMTGMKRYCTCDGLSCNRIDEQTYEIVALGLKVRRASGADA